MESGTIDHQVTISSHHIQHDFRKAPRHCPLAKFPAAANNPSVLVSLRVPDASAVACSYPLGAASQCELGLTDGSNARYSFPPEFLSGGTGLLVMLTGVERIRQTS